MEFITIEIVQGVATVTLNHPGGNRINFQMRQEILDAFKQVAASDARVLLLKGTGTDFCLGGDVTEWPGLDPNDLRPRVEVFADSIDFLEGLNIPTVAVVQGGCMGGGFELALACDLIIAAKSARFMFPEALLGIMTLQGGVYQLAERIGKNKAIELVFLPEAVDAETMAGWNVVNRVFDDAILVEEATAIAARLANGPSQAFAKTKELMRIWRDRGRPDARAALYSLSMPLFDTPQVQDHLRRAADAVKAGKHISPLVKTSV